MAARLESSRLQWSAYASTPLTPSLIRPLYIHQHPSVHFSSSGLAFRVSWFLSHSYQTLRSLSYSFITSLFIARIHPHIFHPFVFFSSIMAWYRIRSHYHLLLITLFVPSIPSSHLVFFTPVHSVVPQHILQSHRIIMVRNERPCLLGDATSWSLAATASLQKEYKGILLPIRTSLG